MKDPTSLTEAVRRLAGLSLSRVAFGIGWVQFDFVGEFNAFLQFNTQVELRTPSAEVLLFDPSRQAVMQAAASALVALIRVVVQGAELGSGQFSLALVGGYEVRGKLDRAAFEPILFSGSHHMRPGQLSWHFAVTAADAP